MSKKQRKPLLLSDMIRLGRWRGIEVTVSEDERSPREAATARQAIWQEKRIWERPAGFSLVRDGRVVSIYYRRDDKVMDLDAEVAGNPRLDIAVSKKGLETWIDVHTQECEPASDEDRKAARADLIDWLTAKGVRFSLGGVIIKKS